MLADVCKVCGVPVRDAYPPLCLAHAFAWVEKRLVAITPIEVVAQPAAALTCVLCGQSFTWEPGLFRVCAPCKLGKAWQMALSPADPKPDQWETGIEDRKRFANLKRREDIAGLDEAVEAARLWLDGLGPPWLVLSGSVGTGKSHIALAAACELSDAGARVLWQPVVALLNRLKRAYDGAEDASTVLTHAMIAHWLVLDDLGRERPTPWASELLYSLIEHRRNRPTRTLVTTNDTRTSLAAKLGIATADRVFDQGSGLVRVVVLSGSSYR